jgi:hypothetical protein
MCALVVGDIHGNFQKVKAFLAYKPNNEHVFVGDYTDSFIATDEDIIMTLTLVFHSGAIILSGNHDNQYFKNAGGFTHCSGYRYKMADRLGILFEMNKHKMVAAHITDDYIITHAGISKGFGEMFDSMDFMVATINSEFDKYKNAVVPPESYSPIFNISPARGGRDMYGGVFWADYRFEDFDERFNQVFGHSHSKSPFEKQTQQFTQLVCVDCPQYICFNTETKEFEDFMPEEEKLNRSILEVSF